MLGQTKPKDIDGWGKIKWGMTFAEASAAYNVSAPVKESDTSKWTSLPLGPVQIGDIEMKASAFTPDFRFRQL
jgi:hypothetical protein